MGNAKKVNYNKLHILGLMPDGIIGPKTLPDEIANPILERKQMLWMSVIQTRK
jgi:hypothetical protein